MKNIICDIDGVLLHDNKLIPGSDKFIQRILEQGNPSSSSQTIRYKRAKIYKIASAPLEWIFPKNVFTPLLWLPLTF